MSRNSAADNLSRILAHCRSSVTNIPLVSAFFSLNFASLLVAALISCMGLSEAVSCLYRCFCSSIDFCSPYLLCTPSPMPVYVSVHPDRRSAPFAICPVRRATPRGLAVSVRFVDASRDWQERGRKGVADRIPPLCTSPLLCPPHVH